MTFTEFKAQYEALAKKEQECDAARCATRFLDAYGKGIVGTESYATAVALASARNHLSDLLTRTGVDTFWSPSGHDLTCEVLAWVEKLLQRVELK